MVKEFHVDIQWESELYLDYDLYSLGDFSDSVLIFYLKMLS